MVCMKLDPRVVASGSEVRCHSEAFNTSFAWVPDNLPQIQPHKDGVSRSCRTMRQKRSFAVSERAADGTLVNHEELARYTYGGKAKKYGMSIGWILHSR